MPDSRPIGYIQPLDIRPRLTRSQPKGLPIVNLSFNELPFRPTDTVLAAINEATASAHIYGNPSCELLRTALASSYQLDADLLVCGNGSEELLDIIGRCFASHGDEIVISEFGYIQFSIVANRVGANLIKAQEKAFTTNIENIVAAVTDKTKIVFLANPNNPTGTIISEVELHNLAEALPSHVVLVIDLAYGEFASKSFCANVQTLVTGFDNVVVTQTFSKAFGLAGLRVGWCHAPQWMIPQLNAARGMGTVNAVAQAGAVAALDEIDFMMSKVNRIVSERERVSSSLSEMGLVVVPSSANFLLVSLSDGDAFSANSLAVHLFDDAGIVVNQTREAGLERFIRFSLSLPEHNTLLLNSLRAYMENH